MTDLFGYEDEKKTETPKPLGDAGIAKALYSEREPKPAADPAEKREAPVPIERKPPSKGPRADAELSVALYGEPQDENYAKVDTNGRVENLLRDVDGRIMFRSFDSRESLISMYPTALSNADLRNTVLPGLPDGDLRGADLRGATIRDIRGCDLRGAILDSSTDISGADFDRTKLDTETFEMLTRCKGFKQAKRLGRPLKAG